MSPLIIRLFFAMKFDPLTPLIQLIYPPLCPACGWMAPVTGQVLCLGCLEQLPETGYHQHHANPFLRHFAGRVNVREGAAFLFFIRGGHTQRLLHRIKYYQQPELAVRLGQWYGRQLAQTPAWQPLDAIVPVPLQWRKQAIRGYNQSERFAAGLSASLGTPCLPDVLERTVHAASLTGMTRMERIEAIRSAFRLRHAEPVRGRHILLVDDVLTTGATLEACTLQLQRAEPASVSLLTLAVGEL